MLAASFDAVSPSLVVYWRSRDAGKGEAVDRGTIGAGVTGIVFDLEGTLVDFQWHLDQAEAELRAELRRLGFAEERFTRESYATMWNLAVTLPEAPVDEATLRARLGPIYDHYDRDALTRWRPRPGAADLLARLAGTGRRLGVVSNIGRAALQPVVDRFGFAPHLDPVVSRDDVRLLKPAGEGIRRCLAAWGLEPERALMVGDSRSDLGAAREAGVKVAIVLGGEVPREGFAAEPPDVFLDRLTGLEALL